MVHPEPPPPAAPRWVRDGRALLLLSLPFALPAAVLAIMAESAGADYWRAADLTLYALLALAGWAFTVAAFLAWTILRDGIRLYTLPGTVLLVAAAAAAAWWEARAYNDTMACAADARLYAAIASRPAEERAGILAAAVGQLRRPSPCAAEQLSYRFGAGAPGGSGTGPADRLAVLAALLDHGLPADDSLLFRFAVADRDPAAAGLVMTRRRDVGAGGLAAAWPTAIIEQHLLPAARPCDGNVADADMQAARAVLRAILTAGPARRPDWPAPTRRALACLEGG